MTLSVDPSETSRNKIDIKKKKIQTRKRNGQWNSRLDIVEERIGELENSHEEITQIKAQRDRSWKIWKRVKSHGR